MYGAALVYNITLAAERIWDEKEDKHRKALQAWVDNLDLVDVRLWSIPRLWELTVGFGHTITPATRRFVEHWVRIVGSHSGDLGDDPSARDLVRRREMSLKRGRSRFTNRRALDQWGGSSGLGRMTYRWTTASTFLDDLHAALKTGGSPC
jgi:hypothetical protein